MIWARDWEGPKSGDLDSFAWFEILGVLEEVADLRKPLGLQVFRLLPMLVHRQY
jgi:hypothetical protein